MPDEAPRTLARWYASLRARGNIALVGATVALVLPVLGLTFFAGALAHRQGLVSDYEKSVVRRLMHPISVGVVNWCSIGSGGGFHCARTPLQLLQARTSPLG